MLVSRVARVAHKPLSDVEFVVDVVQAQNRLRQAALLAASQPLSGLAAADTKGLAQAPLDEVSAVCVCAVCVTTSRYQTIPGKIGESFTILPITYTMPNDFSAFAEDFLSRATQMKEEPDNKQLDNLWIVKPVGLSRGRGISVVRDMAAVGHLKVAPTLKVAHLWLISGCRFLTARRRLCKST